MPNLARSTLTQARAVLLGAAWARGASLVLALTQVQLGEADPCLPWLVACDRPLAKREEEEKIKEENEKYIKKCICQC